MKNLSLSNQRALSFCVYMMVSGNFKKVNVVNPYMEKKFLLDYKELKETDRIKYEDAAARVADRFFLRKLPEYIWDKQSKVLFVINERTGISEVIFLGKGWKLRIVGSPYGKTPSFRYSFTAGYSIENNVKK